MSTRSELIHKAASLPVGHPDRKGILATLKKAKDPADEAYDMVVGGEAFVGKYLEDAVDDLKSEFRRAAKQAETLERKLSMGYRSAIPALRESILPKIEKVAKMAREMAAHVKKTVDRAPNL